MMRLKVAENLLNIVYSRKVENKMKKIPICFDSRDKYCEGCPRFDKCFELEVEVGEP